MSDRTTVELIVRAADLQKHESVFKDPDTSKELTGVLLCLIYYDVDCHSLDFENILQEKRIPYDKKWGHGDGCTGGTEHCRVLSNGSVVVDEFSGEGRYSIDLDEAIRAYQQDYIGDFLEAAKRERASISWGDQEVIMKRREQTSDQLEQLDQEALDDLVVEMCCEMLCYSSDGINCQDDPQDQESVLGASESQASELNKNGREAQITFLLDAGYLSEGLDHYYVPKFELD